MARKEDMKQIDAAARHLGMSDEQRIEFGDFIEDCKASGDRGSKNDRGDFTWKELIAKGREFLGLSDEE